MAHLHVLPLSENSEQQMAPGLQVPCSSYEEIVLGDTFSETSSSGNSAATEFGKSLSYFSSFVIVVTRNTV